MTLSSTHRARMKAAGMAAMGMKPLSRASHPTRPACPPWREAVEGRVRPSRAAREITAKEPRGRKKIAQTTPSGISFSTLYLPQDLLRHVRLPPRDVQGVGLQLCAVGPAGSGHHQYRDGLSVEELLPHLRRVGVPRLHQLRPHVALSSACRRNHHFSTFMRSTSIVSRLRYTRTARPSATAASAAATGITNTTNTGPVSGSAASTKPEKPPKARVAALNISSIPIS